MPTWKWFVYIIECQNGLYYTGMTWNISNRMDQHITTLGSKFTSKYGYKRLVYYEEHDNIAEARIREKQIKDWSRKKKEMLISGKWRK